MKRIAFFCHLDLSVTTNPARAVLRGNDCRLKQGVLVVCRQMHHHFLIHFQYSEYNPERRRILLPTGKPGRFRGGP
jgi:hypothetical protein